MEADCNHRFEWGVWRYTALGRSRRGRCVDCGWVIAEVIP